MRPSEIHESHRGDIRRVVAANRTRNPRIFGSVLTGQDVDGSDLDLLVDPTGETTLLDLSRIQNQLQKLLGVPVDVLTPKALPPQIRDRVLSEAQSV